MAISAPRVEVTEHVKNTMAPACTKSVIEPLEEYRYYLDHRREYSNEEKAEIERTIASRVSQLQVCDIEEYVLDYQGYPLSIYRTLDDIPCAFLGGRERVVVYLDGLEEGEFLSRIEEEFNELTDRAISETQMFW